MVSCLVRMLSDYCILWILFSGVIMLLGQPGVSCVAFLWFVPCVLSVMTSLPFLFVSLVGYVL